MKIIQIFLIMVSVSALVCDPESEIQDTVMNMLNEKLNGTARYEFVREIGVFSDMIPGYRPIMVEFEVKKLNCTNDCLRTCQYMSSFPSDLSLGECVPNL